MRPLLDENMSPRTARILSILGHPSQQVGDVGRLSAPDKDLAEIIPDYDAFVTFDLHRQVDERQAVNEAIVSGGCVIRLRFAKSDRREVMTELRFLIARWGDIEDLLGSRSEIGLLTITDEGQRIRVTSRAEVAQWLGEDR